MKRPSLFILIMVLALLLAPMIANAAPSPSAAALPATPPTGQQQPAVKSPDAACALLDDAQARAAMSGMFETKLLLACGREGELGGVASSAPANLAPTFGADVLVNNPSLDSGASRTQSETAIARNESTGTICSAYNDSYGGVTAGVGYTGFSSSTDGGATFTDHGGLGASSFGDPGLIWRKSDGKFYLGTLHTAGIGMYRSDDDCASFTFIGNPHTGSGDDKELFAVDNNAASPHYGRIYMAWTDFNAGSRIYVTYSDNATTWSSPAAVSGVGVDVQGAWPAVAPNGDVYVAWVRWNPYSTGPIDIEVVRSTNGGVSFAPVTNPLTGGINPRAAGPTASCARPALNGNIRYLPSPQITVSPNGDLHVVYVRDPDGVNVGDVINVYYRRSTDNGATWGPEVLLNDDGTTTDQFFPTISAGPSGRIISTWYDRRLDTANNLMFDYYMRASDDGGVTWQASVRVTDGSSGVVLDPNLATCYHGDYDQQVQTAGTVLVQWSDDRQVVNGTDPNVYFDTQAFAPDYTLSVTPDTLSVCAPSDAVYTVDVGSVLGYTDPVTLAASGNPAGTTTNFSVNPVTPAGSSTLTIGNTGAASAGSSIITVSATSTSGPKTGDVTLNLYNAAAGQTVLTSPADGATNVPVPPTFTWNVPAQADTYSIQIATDAGFSNIVDSASGLTDPTYTSVAPLNTNTLYFWRVQADNTCGTGAYSSVFSFRTVAAPGDCAAGTTPNSLLSEGFESGLGSWTVSGSGASNWTLTNNASWVHSGTQAVHGDDIGSVSDQRLTSPSVVLPIGENPVTLKFWNSQEMEDRTGGCFDGGILEISTDGGANFTQVPNANLLTDPYDGPVSASFGNPLANQDAWCGDPQAYLNSIVDVSSFAGQTVQFRFRLGTDSSVSRVNGWNIDDVVVQSCQPDGGEVPNIFVDPLSMASSQAANTQVQQTLTISNTDGGTLDWSILEDINSGPELVNWSDNFDSYATGSQLIGQGGWEGWDNNAGAGALTSSAEALSAPNSADILGDTDLVHQYSGYTGGQWVYKAWQYVPGNFSGASYFILLNTYAPLGTNNWSLQLCADSGTGMIYDDPDGTCTSGGSLPLVTDQWVEIRVEIDLDTDLQTVYYNNQLLVQDTWTGHVLTGGGALNIGAVDLFANGATSVYYDDMSLTEVGGGAPCRQPSNAPSDIPWLSLDAYNGSNLGGTDTNVTATFDSTGLTPGVYTGSLCVTSNDPNPGPGNETDLVIVPVTLTVQPPTAVALTDLAAGADQMPAPAGLPLGAVAAAGLSMALAGGYALRRRREE